MDASQDKQLQQQSSLDNKYSDAYDLPEEFALLDDKKPEVESIDDASKKSTTGKKDEKKPNKKTTQKKSRSKRYLNIKKQINKSSYL